MTIFPRWFMGPDKTGILEIHIGHSMLNIDQQQFLNETGLVENHLIRSWFQNKF